MLKCQFHAHTSGDIEDNISYSPKQLIDHAVSLGFNVLSITCHKKIIFNKNLKKYAQKKDIILIPGIEFEINKKHILGINVDKEIENIDTFEKLKEYKLSHKNCLIVAPHPFFPGRSPLKKALIENIQLFDAVEYSFCYTTTKNYNNKAIALAKRWKKPIIATSDCHFLKDLDLSYTLVQSQKDPIKIIQAIKNDKISIQTKPVSYFKIAKIIIGINFRKLFKRRSLKKTKNLL